MKLLVVGKPTYNFITEVDNFIVEGTKTIVDKVLNEAGGCGIYTSMLLSKWNVDTSFAGVVGSDEYGDNIKKQLDNAKVNSNFLEINYQNITSTNHIIINKSAGLSTEVLFENPELYLTKYKYDFTPDYIVLDGTDYHGSIAAINNYPNAIKILYAKEVSDKIYDISKKCNYVVASEKFASALTKMELDFKKNKSLVEFMQRVKDLNKASYVVRTNNGSLYVSDNQAKMMPILKPEVIKDTTHEGYMFFAGFVYGIVNDVLDKAGIKQVNKVEVL